MLGSIATGTTQISGFLAGDDCLATMQALRDMGVNIVQSDDTTVAVEGVGLDGLKAPRAPLDLGNSGTGLRLMAGLLAGQRFDSELIGDESLSRRPMERIVDPLTRMGAVIESECDGTPPLQIRGGLRLAPIDFAMQVASAQVKSAVLIASLYANGVTVVTEPATTRDHTERMLRTMGAEVTSSESRISIVGRPELAGKKIQVPADLSSAAFAILAATMADNADVRIESVGVNPTRTGIIDILRNMGADITIENVQIYGEEPVADIRVKSARLTGISVDPGLVSLAIDEFPVLFVAAAVAEGNTTFTGVGELRVKESDRLAAMSSGLRELGIQVDETDDGAVVHGGVINGGVVDSAGDHRIAMSLAVAGSVADGEVTVQNVDNVDTSFPGFAGCMADLGLSISSSAA